MIFMVQIVCFYIHFECASNGLPGARYLSDSNLFLSNKRKSARKTERKKGRKRKNTFRYGIYKVPVINVIYKVRRSQRRCTKVGEEARESYMEGTGISRQR